MRALKLTPRDSRIAAVGLLLLALLLAYFLLLHWWFVAPLRDIDAQMDDLRDTQSRYAAAIAEKPLLEKRIAALGAGQAASDAYLPDDDPNTAAADLMQRVVDAVAAHTEGGSCKVTQKMPVANPQAAPDEPYRKAAASINLSCDIQPLVAVLQSLEQGTPYLFVDNLNVYRSPVPVQGNGLPLEVQFTLSGYVRPANGGAAALATPAPGTGRTGASP
ncbi:type II secretion system protein GspM [Rhodanobacter sp. DHB23]|uniref:type II secretion system protein GspM n=1 Tax=Rhodanobacter sp. DHB23 TaxID=2775923 RepID=UPI00178452C8|nr:type II secretion system protein GspM [Rhodanobacter sp. DHB23]MBD8872723.1 type II secretion system protein M [Rhodanobacter sp. DHB23]